MTTDGSGQRGMASPDQFGDLTAEEIDREIEVRRKLLLEMVGNLYPGVVADEMMRLRALRPAAAARDARNPDRRRTDDNLRGVFG